MTQEEIEDLQDAIKREIERRKDNCDYEGEVTWERHLEALARLVALEAVCQEIVDYGSGAKCIPGANCTDGILFAENAISQKLKTVLEGKE